MPKKSRRRGGGKKAGRSGGTGGAPAAARPAPTEESAARRNSASVSGVSGGDDSTNPSPSSLLAPDALTFPPHQHECFSRFCEDINTLGDWHSLEEFLSHPEMFPLVNQYFNRMIVDMGLQARDDSSIASGSTTMGLCFDLYLLSRSLPEYLDVGTLVSRIANDLLRLERMCGSGEEGFSLTSIPGFPTSDSADGGLAADGACCEEESRALWPYAKRLELFRAFYDKYLTCCSRGDAIGVRNTVISTLRRPLYQTEGVRVSVLAICLSGADAWFDDEAETLVKAIATNEDETMAMRATAMLLRAVVLCNTFKSPFSCTTATANYLRRAYKYASISSDEEWPPSVSLQNVDGVHFQLDTNIYFRGILHEHLDLLKGMMEVTCCEVNDNISYDLYQGVWSHSIGGLFCDGCGKESENCASLFKCKKCRLAFYCNAECQAKAWEAGHHHHCKPYGRFQEGDMAILQSLQKAAHLNNHWVRVEGKAASPGRLAVHLLRDGNETGKVMAVKKKNLRHHRPSK